MTLGLRALALKQPDPPPRAEMNALRLGFRILKGISESKLEGKNKTEVSKACGYQPSRGHELLDLLSEQHLVQLQFVPWESGAHQKLVYLTPLGRNLAETLREFERKDLDPDILVHVSDALGGNELDAKVKLGRVGQLDHFVSNDCERGVCLIEGLYQGRYWIEVECPGYNLFRREIDLRSPGISLQIKLARYSPLDLIQSFLGAVLPLLAIGGVIIYDMTQKSSTQ